MKSSDRLLSKRTEQLAMVESWNEFMSKKLDAWNIPPIVLTQLAAATAAKNAISIPECTA